MKTLKLSSAMHVLIIVSALIVAIGIAVGLICQFLAGGYFNYGAEYKSYDSVVVNYAYIDLSGLGDEDGVKNICDEEFGNYGVSYYSYTLGETDGGGEFTFKFSDKTDAEKVNNAVEAINTRLTTEAEGYIPSNLSGAVYHEATTLKGGGKAYVYGSIALASVIAFQFLYFLIRYRLTMAFAALLANVHNLAVYVSLVTITRVPVGSSVFTFGAVTVIATVIGCCFLFDNMRKKFKDEAFAKLDAFEQVDICASESLRETTFVPVCVAAVAVLIFVLLSISAMSVTLALSSAALAVIGAAASVYGTAFFTPAVYSRFKAIGDEYKKNRSLAKAADKADKKA